MILARISRAIREQNWFAVVLEFVIVISGVVIGFQVTEWSKDRERAVYERAALERLHSETEQSVIYLRRFVDIYDRFNSHRTEAIERLLENEFEDADIQNMTIGVTSASFLPVATPQTGTYNEIVNAGLLSTIGDTGFRSALAGYRADLEFLQGQITYFRQATAQKSMALDFDEVTVAYAPGTSRERVFIVDFDRAARNPDFIERVLLDNNLIRAVSGWWEDALASAENLCRETARLTQTECQAIEEPEDQ